MLILRHHLLSMEFTFDHRSLILLQPSLLALLLCFVVVVLWWGDGLAQWLERWTGDPKVEGSNPVRSTRKTSSVFESKKGCADSLPNPRVYLYARIRKTMYAR